MNQQPNKDYVVMLKYQPFDRLSSGSPPGQIRILTSNIKKVVKMLQTIQNNAHQSGRFGIMFPRANVIDIVLSPNANPVLIYEMISCRVDGLRNEIYDKAVMESGQSITWALQDESEIEVKAQLVKTSAGDVVVRPVLSSLNGVSANSKTKKLPDRARLLAMGIVLPPEI